MMKLIQQWIPKLIGKGNWIEANELIIKFQKIICILHSLHSFTNCIKWFVYLISLTQPGWIQKDGLSIHLPSQPADIVSGGNGQFFETSGGASRYQDFLFHLPIPRWIKINVIHLSSQMQTLWKAVLRSHLSITEQLFYKVVKENPFIINYIRSLNLIYVIIKRF